MKKRRVERREEQVAADGGLLPQARNAVHALEIRALQTPDKVALTDANGTTSYTWKEYYHQVQQFGRALLASEKERSTSDDEQLGVAVHAFNEPRWFFSALGALAAGWTVSGIYLTNTYDQAAHVLRTSNVQVLVLENRELLDTVYQNVFKDFSTLTVVLLQGGDENPSSRTPSYQAFVSKSVNVKMPPPAELPDDAVASLVYTSGTTGNPKAVELTHKNITSVCAMMHARIPLDEHTRVVSYLPLSHIAAMGIDLFSSLYCGAHVYFADSNALKGSLKDTLLRVRPTLFFGVPRVWQKMEFAMQSAAAKSYSKRITGPVLKAIGSAAKTVGGLWWNYNTPEVIRCGILAIPFAFFKTIAYKKVRRGCGLDRCKLLYTGAAPLPADTINYLRSLDMPLLEVFGMSESTGAIAVCGPNDLLRPVGACGRALPLGTLEIAKSDGEIIWKGDNNMIGYKGLPAATQATLPSSTGKLHTGDIGMIDDLGYLYITGRKKDLLITAGGENVAPTPIEEQILSLIGTGNAGHVVLIGDARKFLSMLVAPCENGTIPPAGVVENALQEYNSGYAMSRAQKVQKAHVLELPFQVSTGELTPTMKVKRAAIVTKFRKEIETMYSEDSAKLVGYSSMNIGTIDPSIA
jgi:long-chain-fatty-acid--CoA ligase ACSBG